MSAAWLILCTRCHLRSDLLAQRPTAMAQRCPDCGAPLALREVA